ncbi:MAG TPA: ComF family protein, partial [Anaerolineae bacterium]
CGGCGIPGSLWCEPCQSNTLPLPSPACARCSQPGVHSGLCSNCRASPPVIDSIRSMTLFEGRIRHAIHAFKYDRRAALADPLGDALACFWQHQPTPAQVVVPVPLHPRRQKERGYNQSELLARRLGHVAGLPVRPTVLHRTRVTASQMTLNAADRRANVADAFQANAAAVRGLDVLLIDDVCTTGATLDACAMALKAAGAQAVHGLTLARTP